MPTVSSVALGGLQAVALLAAVVVAGSRLLIAGLDPHPEQDEENVWVAKVIAYGAIVSLIAFFVAAVLFIIGLMGAYGMPPLLDLAFIFLLLGVMVFAVPMALLIFTKRNQGKLPSLNSP